MELYHTTSGMLYSTPEFVYELSSYILNKNSCELQAVSYKASPKPLSFTQKTKYKNTKDGVICINIELIGMPKDKMKDPKLVNTDEFVDFIKMARRHGKRK